MSTFPTEAQEQKAVIDWAKLIRIEEGLLVEHLVMIPNESILGRATPGERRAILAGMHSRGMKAGASDLFLAVPRGTFHGLWIEMKRDRRAFRSEREADAAWKPAQREFAERRRAAGYRAEVCYGWVAARDVIESYLRA